MSVRIYDDFATPGYALADYDRMWMTPNGLGEMEVRDTRDFPGGSFTISAAPFQTGFDVGVDDHRKYLAVSTFGHGLFSLLDAFPFRYPGAPD